LPKQKPPPTEAVKPRRLAIVKCGRNGSRKSDASLMVSTGR
jgi:hypothetical protein